MWIVAGAPHTSHLVNVSVPDVPSPFMNGIYPARLAGGIGTGPYYDIRGSADSLTPHLVEVSIMGPVAPRADHVERDPRAIKLPQP
jgi:hypothetical protein